MIKEYNHESEPRYPYFALNTHVLGGLRELEEVPEPQVFLSNRGHSMEDLKTVRTPDILLLVKKELIKDHLIDNEEPHNTIPAVVKRLHRDDLIDDLWVPTVVGVNYHEFHQPATEAYPWVRSAKELWKPEAIGILDFLNRISGLRGYDYRHMAEKIGEKFTLPSKRLGNVTQVVGGLVSKNLVSVGEDSSRIKTLEVNDQSQMYLDAVDYFFPNRPKDEDLIGQTFSTSSVDRPTLSQAA